MGRWTQAEQSTSQRGKDPESTVLSSSPPFIYTVVWKLQWRKGRIMTLTGDIVEDIA